MFDEDHGDEVNKTAEDMVKRGSELHPPPVDEDDDGVMLDRDSRRNDGISEANLAKSNCMYSKSKSINQTPKFRYILLTIITL